MDQEQGKTKPRVVIIGCGFGGMQLAQHLKHAPVEVLMLDKHNYHTFQPLLYQVAMGDIAADSIGFPIRRIFTHQKNFRFHLAEVQKILPESNTITTSIGNFTYDYLVIATGANTNYFGNQEIEHFTMPMKNIAEALNMRSLTQQNLEKALVTTDVAERESLLTFVVVGGGPTGVELSGALAEMRRNVLCKDFPGLKMEEMKVYLIEGKPDLLASMSKNASAKAKEFLLELGVEIHTGVHVKSYNGEELIIDDGKSIRAKNVFWAAGVRGEVVDGLTGATITKGTRIQTDEISRVNGYANIFAIGDVAAMITPAYPNGLPGVAPAAMQTGQHLAKNLVHLIKGEPTIPFKYLDKGSLATIGRNKAVADLWKFHFYGFIAWILWMFVHIMTLVGFTNKAVVFASWATNYFRKNSDNRLVVRYFNTQSMMAEPIAK
jgi:NADH dehydrogenase